MSRPGHAGRVLATARRFTSQLAAVSVLALGLGACASQPTGYSDFDRETDFSGYRSFAWISANPLVVASVDPVNPALEGIIMDEVKSYLEARGFRFADNVANADMVIGFSVGGNETLRSTVYPGQYRQDVIIGQTMRTEVHAQDSTEGGIVIDVFDRESKQKKWMGWALRELTMNDLRELRPAVRELVSVILDHFPPS